MDLTETYTKQCDCPEIQGLVISLKKHHDNHTYWHRKIPLRESIQDYLNDSIWLPRQDEIQGLVLGYYKETNPEGWIEPDVFLVFNMFNHWRTFCQSDTCYFRLYRKIDFSSNSLEQLWLMFYLYERYKKIWDGSRWTNSTTTEIPIAHVKGSEGHKERLKEIDKILNDPDAKKKQKENWAEMKRMGKG